MKGPRESKETSNNQLAVPASDTVNGNLLIAAQAGHMCEREVDFSEYEWMGEEMEEFDRKVSHCSTILTLAISVGYSDFKVLHKVSLSGFPKS